MELRIKSGWISALALLACFASPLSAATQTPPITGIAHLAFRVHNLAAERAFFRRLGFEEAFVLPSPDNPSEVFVKINDRQFIELYPQTAASQPLGWMHVCYESNALNSLEALYAAHDLKPSAVEKAGAGNLLFSLHDPEGRVTEFTQYLPGSRHTLDRGKHLGAHRIATDLLGFSLPSANLTVDRQFYTAGLGFAEQESGSSIRLRLAGISDLRIELYAAAANARMQAFFAVPNISAAARALRSRGLSANRRKNSVSVKDLDGNIFVFAANKTL